MANTGKGARKRAQKGAKTPQSSSHALTLGEFAHQVITEQFRRIVKHTAGVLDDKDPEHLHQMRGGTRRLRTALQVFESAIALPKRASAKRLRDLARALGAVRDLDVQAASLSQDYQTNLNKREQKKLRQVSQGLQSQRKASFAAMQRALTQRKFRQIKTAYEGWLQQPHYTSVAKLPLVSVLPDVLSPLLSELFLHPGWLIATTDISEANAGILHDLRKVCKHVRYQAEFFTDFYGEEFRHWVKEIKTLQDDLGTFQDTQVLQALLTDKLGRKTSMPELQSLIRQKQAEALGNWEEVRQKYLDSGFRYHLHEMLLQPTVRSAKVHPELVNSEAMNLN
jgi:CHAD domain-containing protein